MAGHEEIRRVIAASACQARARRHDDRRYVALSDRRNLAPVQTVFPFKPCSLRLRAGFTRAIEQARRPAALFTRSSDIKMLDPFAP
jgi:hypothetical protein